jgi:pimeloyl-ACP methyl ester carboxylesterase
MFSSKDENLLGQNLPELRSAAIELPHYPGGQGAVEYREAGAQDLPALLLMHGIGSNSAGYRAQLAGLQDRYRVIAWNAPGYGSSTPLADPQPTCKPYVDAAVALLNALGVTQLAGLVGSSWGSVVATAFAHSSGFPLRSLILSATNKARGVEQTAEQREAARQAALSTGLASFKQERQVVADRLLAGHASPSVRAHTMRLRDAVTPEGWQQAMNMLFTVYTPKILADVVAKVTVVVGCEDKVAPEDMHAWLLLSARPDMTYHRLAGVGHMPKLEAPTAFNRLVHESITSA